MIEEDTFLVGYWLGAFFASILVGILSLLTESIVFVLTLSIGCFIMSIVYICKIIRNIKTKRNGGKDNEKI